MDYSKTLTLGFYKPEFVVIASRWEIRKNANLNLKQMEIQYMAYMPLFSSVNKYLQMPHELF